MGAIYAGLALMLYIYMVMGTGRFEVSILAMYNNDGYREDGMCCSGRHSPCTSVCRTFVSLCLQHFSTSTPETPLCTYGQGVTPVLGGNSINESLLAIHNDLPVKIAFQFSWPGAFSLITEVWHDRFRNRSKTDISNRILRSVVTEKISPPSEWRIKTSKHNGMKLKFKYRVICEEFYYSATCEQICRDRNDNFGHYVCNEKGQKMCLPGWQGEFCQEALCASTCNRSHGYCDQPFECRCLLGWAGEFCDRCIPNPGCVHGYCKTPWQCICEDGWTGRNCDIEQHYCSKYEPCKNGGTCVSGESRNFTCACSNGYTGVTCENSVCFTHECENGGQCNGTNVNNAECICTEDFYGKQCQIKKLKCADIVCGHGGTCHHGPMGAYCSCREGYEGIFCSHEIDECRSNPCHNGGTCLDGINDFVCRCPDNYMGKRCNIVIDPCYGVKCLHGGKCVTTTTFQSYCDCMHGYTGERCEIPLHSCKGVMCKNGGTCISTKNGSSKCLCNRDFGGRYCEISLSFCDMPCRNGGKCKRRNNYMQCVCLPEYGGQYCEIPLFTPNLAQSHPVQEYFNTSNKLQIHNMYYRIIVVFVVIYLFNWRNV